MSDFGHFKNVVGRRPHRCEHCQGEIAQGEKHWSVAGRFDGDFQAYRIHHECQDAATDYSKVAGLIAGDEFPWLWRLGENEPEDRLWLREAYPAIAARVDAKFPLAGD